MTARRIVAVLAAVVLIGGALFVRQRHRRRRRRGRRTDRLGRHDRRRRHRAAAASSAAPSSRRRARPSAPPTPSWTCRVEPAGTTLDRLAAPDGTDAPVWLTVAPFPAMADSLRTAAGLDPLGGPSTPSPPPPLVVATPTGGRSESLATGCAGTPLWRVHRRPRQRAVDRHRRRRRRGARCARRSASSSPTPPRSARSPPPSPATSAHRRSVPLGVGVRSGVHPVAAPPGRRRQSPALSAGTPLATMATRAGALDIAATTEAARIGLGARADASTPATLSRPCGWRRSWRCPTGSRSPTTSPGSAACGSSRTPDGTVRRTATQSLPGASTMLALRDALAGGPT